MPSRSLARCKKIEENKKKNRKSDIVCFMQFFCRVIVLCLVPVCVFININKTSSQKIIVAKFKA